MSIQTSLGILRNLLRVFTHLDLLSLINEGKYLRIKTYILKVNYKRRFWLYFLFSWEAVSTLVLERFLHKSLHMLHVSKVYPGLTV